MSEVRSQGVFRKASKSGWRRSPPTDARNRRLLAATIATTLLALLVLWAPSAHATAYTWNITTAGNWSTTTNWSPNGTPGASDSVTFNSSKNGNCTIDVQVSISALTISGYTGTIATNSTSSTTRSISIAGNLTVGFGSGGVLNINDASATTNSMAYLAVGADLSLTAGTINMNDGGVGATTGSTHVRVDGNMTISGTGTLGYGVSSGTGSTYLHVLGNFTRSAGTFYLPDNLIVGGVYSNTGDVLYDCANGCDSPGTGGSTSTGFTTSLLSSTSRNHSFGGEDLHTVSVSDGLFAHWKLNGNGNDAGGLGLGLTSSGTITYTEAAPLAFDNSSGATLTTGAYLHLTDYISTLQTSTWSVSAWVKPTSTGGNIALVGTSTTPDFGIRLSTSFIQAHKRTSSGSQLCTTTAPNVVTDGAWHHILATNDGSTVTVYVDGESRTTCTIGAQVFSSDGFFIGGDSAAATYAGGIDDVRLFNRSLSGSEALALAAGGQPVTGVATHTFGGTFYTTHDLILGSGTLEFGSNSVTVEGSLWNYGVTLSGSGTVTLSTDGGNKSLRTNHQRFSILTINTLSSGNLLTKGLIFADDLNIIGGALDTTTEATSPVVAYVKNLTQSAGTITNSSTYPIVLDGGGASTLSLSGSVAALRIEDPRETGLVGHWKFDRFLGNTSPDLSGNGNTATLYNGTRITSTKPAPTASPSGSPSFVNSFALAFDGDNSSATYDDYVQLGTSNMPASNAAQTIALWARMSDVSVTQNFISLRSDGNPTTVGIDDGIQIGVVNDGGAKVRVWKPGASGTMVQTAAGAVTTGTWYHVAYTYDPSEGASGTHRLYIDGVLASTESAIAPDVVTPDQALLGAYDLHTTQRLQGYLDDVRIYTVELSASEIGALVSGRYPGRGGGAIITQGSSVAVTGQLSIDNGVLATSTYDLAASSTTDAAYVHAGGFTLGSGTATFSGGFTSRGPSVLTLNTTGGALVLGNAKTLTVDGTLASDVGTSAPKPTIRSASGSFTFTVGSSASATPTLNINGLAVQGTGTNGMYVNTVAGSSTTFTRFDRLAFSDGTGSYLLRIYAAALDLVGNGLTFDKTGTSFNARVEGNGTGDGETKVFFGATCTPDQGGTDEECELNDSDDDADDNGVGDTTASNAGVVQWGFTGYADLGGTVEGFPTAAWDWDTFALWRTYVNYNNVSGNTDRLYARDTDGAALYSWDLPDSPSNELFVGTPRWTVESGSHYVYVVSSLGNVYKLLDTGSALSLVSGWPYRNGTSATGTSPLVLDGNNLYWSGNDGSGSPMVFSLTYGRTLNGTRSVTAGVSAFLSIAALSGSNYLFAATNGRVYQMPVSLGGDLSATQPTSGVSGRVTVLSGGLTFIENTGKVWGLSAASLTTNWSYQDTDGARHPGGCTSANQCSSKNVFVDFASSRAYFGDKDGHLYAVYSSGGTGTAVSGFPLRPGTSSDEIQAAPLYRGGIIAVGTTTGKVFFIDQQNGGSAPALIKSYAFGAGVSTIGYDRNSSSSGEYMIGTNDGKLYYVSSITDPTPSNN